MAWKAAISATLLLAAASPAHAEKLISLWRPVPNTPTGEQTVKFGDTAFEQRLVPVTAARLTEDAVTEGGSTRPAGTFLFLVRQADGQEAYCTHKDFSSGNLARSLFIPIADRRPCYVDRDRDGRFEASFSVFDKYGSALTPSGDLDKASPLASPVAYSAADPLEFPLRNRMLFNLGGRKDVARARIWVQFDNGSGRLDELYATSERAGSELLTFNTTFRFLEIVENTARVEIVPDTELIIMGDSNGAFAAIPEALLAPAEQDE
jgi:hypothetical protein